MALTDSAGVLLWGTETPHNYLTDSAGSVLTDSDSEPLWSA